MVLFVQSKIKRTSLCYLIVSVICIKAAYFYDSTELIQSPTPKRIKDWKQQIQSNKIVSTFGPIVFMVALEYSMTKYLKIMAAKL